MKPHEKIINDVAKSILTPEGFFRKGTSRVWLEDNGYYMTQIEFQPSGFSKGSYLNVGVSFLWEATEVLNGTLAFDYRYRAPEVSFISYNGNDEKFLIQMEKFAEKGLEISIEYRKFRSLTYAKQALKQQFDSVNEQRLFWEVYQLAMLCFLIGDFEEGKNYFQKYMDILKANFYSGDVYIEWHEQFYNYCKDNLLPNCKTKECAQNMVLDMIKRRRDFFSSKPSFKKMDKGFTFSI